jgi:hypothetical protein
MRAADAFPKSQTMHFKGDNGRKTVWETLRKLTPSRSVSSLANPYSAEKAMLAIVYMVSPGMPEYPRPLAFFLPDKTDSISLVSNAGRRTHYLDHPPTTRHQTS